MKDNRAGELARPDVRSLALLFTLLAMKTMSQKSIELQAKDLDHQGNIACPNPQSGIALWSGHPKVYLAVARTGQAVCPYCGTEYRLRAGEKVAAGH